MTATKLLLLISIVAVVSSCNSDLEDQQTLTSDLSNDVVSSTSVVPVVSEIRLGRIPTKEEPLRVMIIGDSATYEIEPALSAALKKTGVVETANRTQFGFGLSQWPRYKWWDIWPCLLYTSPSPRD